MKELPSYKPAVKLLKQGRRDLFRPLPYIEDGKLFFHYSVSSNYELDPLEKQVWMGGGGMMGSPDVWYLHYVELGSHKNRDKLPAYFTNINEVPQEIEDLYTSFWQIRLVLQHPSCQKKMKDAEYAYEWYKFDTVGF